MADEATKTDAADQSTADSAVKQEQTTDTATESKDVAEGEKSLGDAGKKALDAMKAERNEAKAEAKRIADEFAALKAQVEGKQAEFEAEKKARELEAAALSKANERILKAEVRAAAAAKLADPQDALRFLDLSTFEVGTDGEVDGDAVASAINDLIQTKPYLAAQGKRFEGSADGGARNDAAQTAQLTDSDLERMSPEQIEEARKAGRLNDLLGIKS
jgi:hypothetical protein